MHCSGAYSRQRADPYIGLSCGSRAAARVKHVLPSKREQSKQHTNPIQISINPTIATPTTREKATMCHGGGAHDVSPRSTTMNIEQRYFCLSTYFHQRFGQRVQKIPLYAGFSCPNRDGSLSTSGCIFCNPMGSGSGEKMQHMSLRDQYMWWRDTFYKKYKVQRFLAYLQSFTNTYGPLSKLTAVLDQLRDLPEIQGLCIGTRPDCVDREKISALAAFPGSECWLELGLQSSNDSTLKKINRGHDAASFARAATMASEEGLAVCAHIIAGLPGESRENFLQTIAFVNDLPVQGIKIHNLYVCRGTTLGTWWEHDNYVPLQRAEYIDWVIHGLAILRPDIVIHRINGDPQPGELLAPAWAGNKSQILQAIHNELCSQDIWQGQLSGYAATQPPWFSRSYQGDIPPCR